VTNTGLRICTHGKSKLKLRPKTVIAGKMFIVRMTFWGVAPNSLVELHPRFRDAYCLHHLLVEEVSISETSIHFCQTTQHSRRIHPIRTSVRTWNLTCQSWSSELWHRAVLWATLFTKSCVNTYIVIISGFPHSLHSCSRTEPYNSRSTLPFTSFQIDYSQLSYNSAP
jgi:hypothetical protein